MHGCFLACRHLVAYSRVLRFRLFVDLARTEGLDSLKVDKGRLGQLRELGRHESRHIKPQVVSFVYPVSNAQLCCFRCGNRLDKLRGLGRQSTRQASSGSLRLPCCALRGRVDFRQIAGF